MKVQQVSPGIINKIKSLIARVGYLKSDIGIVEDTDTATHTISSGQYVIWKNELYKASAAIPSGDPLSSTNLMAVSDGIANELNSNINTYREWHQITGVQENVETQVSTSYKEVYIDCQFSAGQHICFHLIPGVRQDSGFYYNSNSCGGGAASLTATNKLTIFHPYYGGSQTTFSSITVWGR